MWTHQEASMKVHMSLALVLCAVSAPFALAKAKTSATADPALQADRTLTMALEKGDRAVANKLLDADFNWIDTDGINWSRADALRAGLKPLVGVGPDVKITEYYYGRSVAWIQHNEGKNKFAAHFWVRRPSGWRLLLTNEIDVRPASEEQMVRPNYEVPCINPCKEIPFKSLTASEKAMLAAWQDQESGNGDHDMYMGKDLLVVNSYSNGFARRARQKAMEAAGKIKPHMAPNPANAGRPKVGAAPALYVREWDFGDAIVTLMLQPTYGGKAYWSTRIFSDAGHKGFWKMEQSYHTFVQASPVMTAVPLSELRTKPAAGTPSE
jgi:hypothetical protein